MGRKTILIIVSFMLASLLYAQSIVEEIDAIKTQHDLMGGMVTMVCENGIYQTIPFGWADYEREILVNEETMFRIASVSKSVTAVALMQLVEQGLIGLDENVSSYLGFQLQNPNFVLSPITSRQLLSHTSSIVDGSGYSAFLSATYNFDPMPPLNQLLGSAGSYYTSDMFNNTLPGTYFNYSNINFGIIGTLVEKLSGQRFDEYIKEHILDPLEIAGSFNVNHIPDINNIAVLYRKISGSWVAQADHYQGVQPVYGNLDGYIPGTNGLRFAPQGGLRVSTSDILKVFIALSTDGNYNGVQILEQETVQLMRSEAWLYNGANGNDYYGLFKSWGLGLHRITNTPNSDMVLSISDFMFGHPGEAYGLVSDVYMDPQQGLGLAFITNGCGAGYQLGNQSAFYTVEEDIFNAVSQELENANCLLATEEVSTTEQSLVYIESSHQIRAIGDAKAKGVLQVFSLYGQLVFQKSINNHQAAIQLPELNPGIYLIRLNDYTLKIQSLR